MSHEIFVFRFLRLLSMIFSLVAVFSKTISHLTEHMKLHRKDFSTLRKLLIIVGKRKRLLRYLRKTDLERYVTLVKRLGLPDR